MKRRKETFVDAAKRIGQLDRVVWVSKYDMRPEELFRRDRATMLKEVDHLLLVAISRLVMRYELCGYEISSGERSLLTFDCMATLYLEGFLALCECEFEALVAKRPRTNIADVICDLLQTDNCHERT